MKMQHEEILLVIMCRLFKWPPSWCMIKIFRGEGVVDGEGVGVKDASSGVVEDGGH